MSKDGLLLIALLALCLAGCQAPRQVTVEVSGYGVGTKITIAK